MQIDLILIKEYCQKTNLEPSFFIMLEESGLIDIYIVEGEKQFPTSQLADLERFARMYYDLHINMEGIDAIHHILNRMKRLQDELNHLRSKLRLYE
ncbi:MAG: chaperone modulator CbpM [Bacteroides sp.]|nr:chaperone modulator CbpM [Bacteroides sp.]